MSRDPLHGFGEPHDTTGAPRAAFSIARASHPAAAHLETVPDSMFAARPQIEITTSIDTHRAGELAVARETFASLVEGDCDRQQSPDRCCTGLEPGIPGLGRSHLLCAVRRGVGAL